MNEHDYTGSISLGALSISLMIVFMGTGIRLTLIRIAAAIEALKEDDTE